MLPPPNLGSSKVGFFGGDLVGVVEVDVLGPEVGPVFWLCNDVKGLAAAPEVISLPAAGEVLELNAATDCELLAGADCGIMLLSKAAALDEDSAPVDGKSVVDAALKLEG